MPAYNEYKNIKYEMVSKLRVFQLKELISNAVRETMDDWEREKEARESKVLMSEDNRFIYGLDGLAEFLNISHSTASKYKRGFLRSAATQTVKGGKIVFDREKVTELFKRYKEMIRKKETKFARLYQDG